MKVSEELGLHDMRERERGRKGERAQGKMTPKIGETRLSDEDFSTPIAPGASRQPIPISQSPLQSLSLRSQPPPSLPII